MKAEEIAALREWIAEGAYWPTEAPAQTSKSVGVRHHSGATGLLVVPARETSGGPGGEVADIEPDRQLHRRPARSGRIASAAPRADKRTLIRRATIDLTGLPPTPEEVDAFLKDESPDAFAKVVDRLLASPRYGERWARYWLDVARYADDSFLSTEDKPYPNSWRYRNWVIQAFNKDMPYDKFVKAQIAGDQIGEPAGDRILCTQSGDAGRSRRCDDPRVSRADGRVCAVPRSQVRSDSDEGLLLDCRRSSRIRSSTSLRWRMKRR